MVTQIDQTPSSPLNEEAVPLDVIQESFQGFLGNLRHTLESYEVSSDVAQLSSQAIGLVLVLILSFLSNFIAKRLILRLINRGIDRSRLGWLQTLQQHRFFSRFSHLAPAWVIWSLTPLVVPSLTDFIHACAGLYLLFIGWLLIDSLLNSLNTLSQNNSIGQKVPIKGFTQAVKLIVFLIAFILALSILFGQSPVFFLSGLGALTAVLLLVFRDALLGLVAGIMISVNSMVRIGDWIEMPGTAVDGHVIDVSLTTVKVRNWDKTVTTIPSYDLISKSFKNWEAMFTSGGRRIKRALYIDMRSVRFLKEPMIEKMLKIRRLKTYLQNKVEEVQASNLEEYGNDLEALCNGRRLTNLGTFRAYCEAYLREHPKINKEMILLVRQLAPTEHGLPLEIYAFTSDTPWVLHEGVQADIFDHLISVMEEFDLKIFQSPSGTDIRSLARAQKEEPPLPQDAQAVASQDSITTQGSAQT